MITVKQRWPAWAQETSRSRSYVKCGNIELFSCQGSVLYASLQVMLSGMEGAARSRRSLPAALACATLISLAIACSPFGVLPATDAQKVVPFVTPPSPARLAYVTGTARSAPAVWAVRANEKRGVRLGPGIEPLLSPDGRAVAAASFGGASALIVYSTVGGRTGSYLSSAAATAQPVAWSHDSRYLAIVSEPSNPPADPFAEPGARLQVIDTLTGAIFTLAEGQIFGASFAPESSDRLAFGLASSAAPSAPVNIYIANPNGTPNVSVAKPPPNEEFVPLPGGGSAVRFTSDGRSLNPVWGSRYIAYDRERLRPNFAPRYDIWLGLPANPGFARRLTNVPAGKLVTGLVPLAFSAAGDRLLAEFEGQDTSEAWTVRVPSGRARRLTVRRQAVQGAGISRDGRTVLIEQGAFENPPSRGRIASIPFAGGRPRVLVAHGAQPRLESLTRCPLLR